jgi:hypothetical protein
MSKDFDLGTEVEMIKCDVSRLIDLMYTLVEGKSEVSDKCVYAVCTHLEAFEQRLQVIQDHAYGHYQSANAA